MNRFKYRYVALLVGVLLFWAPDVTAYDLVSRYVTVSFSDYDDLRQFNNELYMGRLNSKIKKSRGYTIEDEVMSKIDFIVEKVMAVLDMFPAGLKFSMVINANEKQVQNDFKKLYKVDVDYIAFYSPSKNTVFYSADNATLKVVAHEIGHVVAENYFTISPPQRIHEVMAQFAEQHISD